MSLPCVSRMTIKAWTDPELLKQWFAPLPFTTLIAEVDLRPGGANLGTVSRAVRR
ncbi:MAG: SRPBCC domain-containing protein [Candidatus Binataceae bacterium]